MTDKSWTELSRKQRSLVQKLLYDASISSSADFEYVEALKAALEVLASATTFPVAKSE